MAFGCLITRLPVEALQEAVALSHVLPGIDEVLGDADTGRRARDRDLAHGWAISGAGNFDVSSRDLANLIDLAALSSNYAANKLEGMRGKHVNGKSARASTFFWIQFLNSMWRKITVTALVHTPFLYTLYTFYTHCTLCASYDDITLL